MQCPSCRAPNKEEAKFCAECGKPLAPGTDDEHIERLVEYFVYYGFDGEEHVLDAESAERVRAAAREVHAKWKANPRIEDVEVHIDDVRSGKNETTIDETFDGDELYDIFSGREAVGRAEEERRREAEEERELAEARERIRKKEEEKQREKETDDALWSKYGFVVIVGLIGVTGAIIYFGEKLTKHKEKEHEEEPSADKHESHRSARTTPATATTTTTATPVPDPPPPVAIASCTCVSRANGKNTFVLEKPPAGGPWHMKWNQVSGFTSMNSGFWLAESDAGAATSIPRDTTQLQAVMACENEIVVVVAGDVASAWTGTDRGELLWTRKLPAPWAFPKDAGITDDVACAPTLGVTGNVLTVPLAKGKTIALSIRDGSIQK